MRPPLLVRLVCGDARSTMPLSASSSEPLRRASVCAMVRPRGVTKQRENVSWLLIFRGRLVMILIVTRWKGLV